MLHIQSRVTPDCFLKPNGFISQTEKIHRHHSQFTAVFMGYFAEWQKRTLSRIMLEKIKLLHPHFWAFCLDSPPQIRRRIRHSFVCLTSKLLIQFYFLPENIFQSSSNSFKCHFLVRRLSLLTPREAVAAVITLWWSATAEWKLRRNLRNWNWL